MCVKRLTCNSSSPSQLGTHCPSLGTSGYCCHNIDTHATFFRFWQHTISSHENEGSGKEIPATGLGSIFTFHCRICHASGITVDSSYFPSSCALRYYSTHSFHHIPRRRSLGQWNSNGLCGGNR